MSPDIELLLQAEALASSAYVNPQVFDEEQKAIFRKRWVAAAFEHDLPAAGDAVPVDIAGVPVLLWRDAHGEIKAFVNVCRHRGSTLVRKPTNLRERVTCPYHAWTYDQAGELRAAPFAHGRRTGAFHKAEGCNLNLLPVSVGTWMDTVFVDVSGEAGPLPDHVAPLAKLWELYDIPRLHRFHTEGGVIHGNWKLAIEASVDTYHEGFVHPGLQHRLTQEGIRPFDDLANGEMFGLAWIGDTGLRSDSPVVPLRDGAREEQRRDSLCFLFPNAQFNLFGGLSVRTIWTPVSVRETAWRSSWYLVDAWADDPAHEDTRRATVTNWRQIRDEDKTVVENVHRGRDNGTALGTHFAPFWELTGQSFQRLWSRSMGAPA